VNLARHFGEAVRRQRLLVRLSQEELGARADLDRTYVSGVERGRRNPTLTVLYRLSEALGVDLEVLFAATRTIAAEERRPGAKK
jgi:transcriptional regulator with XRE-family HTH domain